VIIAGRRSMIHVGLIVFDTKNEAQERTAYEVCKSLVEPVARLGYGEYRSHLDFMDLVADQYDFNHHAQRRFNELLKDTLDSNGILSPGKQGIWPCAYRGERAGHGSRSGRRPQPQPQCDTTRASIMATNADSWVLITGASSGFGEEFARQYAANGHALILVARRLDRLQALAAALHQEYGIKVIVEQANLSDLAAVTGLHESLRERGIAVEVLINNAGHGLQGPFLDTPMQAAVVPRHVGHRLCSGCEAEDYVCAEASDDEAGTSGAGGDSCAACRSYQCCSWLQQQGRSGHGVGNTAMSAPGNLCAHHERLST
jgi:hypothetical protein